MVQTHAKRATIQRIEGKTDKENEWQAHASENIHLNMRSQRTAYTRARTRSVWKKELRKESAQVCL